MGKRILIAAPIHQSKEIFIEYLNSINHLIIPEGYEIKKFFYLHNCSELKDLLEINEYEIVENNVNFYKDPEKQKQWTKDNFMALYKMRTDILKKAREEKFDYIFTVDSDVLLHPKTLIKLLNDDKAIIGNLLYTKMNDKISAICGESENWKAYDDFSFLKKPGVYSIGWTCACLLISSKIFNNSNISYYPIIGVDNTGCEDYAFCLRIKCNFPEDEIYIDTTYPARHLYHKKDYERWVEDKKQYE